MKRSIFLRLKEILSRNSKRPWAAFETSGVDEEGRMAFAVYFNKAFVNNSRSIGIEGATDEEVVQLFFLQLRVAPESMLDEDTVNPEGTPQLTSEANQFIRG